MWERRVPRAFDTIFTKSQRGVLSAFAGGPREREAQNITNLLLERKGFLRRLSEPRPSRLVSDRVIEWEITPAGRAMLQRAGDLGTDPSLTVRAAG